MVTCVYGAVIIPATELITCVLKNTASATAAIIENSLQEFEDSLQHTASVFRNTFDVFIFNGKNILFLEYSVNKVI